MKIDLKSIILALLIAIPLIFGSLPSRTAAAELSSDPGNEEQAWNLFSPDQDIRLGEELDEWVRQNIQFDTDPAVLDLLDRLNQRLTRGTRLTPFPYHLQPLSDRGLYSLANPGGPVYVTNGLIAVTKDETQLAGIMAHQIAHVSLRHITRELSRAKRFKVRAAMVAASTGKKSLVQALEEADLAVVPGAPTHFFSPEVEIEANRLAAQILADAGYDPLSVSRGFQNLHEHHSDEGADFLTRHPQPPVPETLNAELPSWKPATRLVSKWEFRRLKKSMSKSYPDDNQLKTLLAWSPPARKIEPAKTRERFITTSYQFSYPMNWVPGKPGFFERIQVAPKSGLMRTGGEQPQLAVGVMAGAIDLADHSATPLETLLDHINDIRPGMAPAADQLNVKPVDRQLHGILLEGQSPLAGQRELAWAVTTRLQDKLFYLLMIAPDNEYLVYQPEFKAIFESIEFEGPPQFGRMEAFGQDG